MLQSLTCSCMCSKGSGVEFRENAPESVEEEEEEGRRLLRGSIARFLLGSLASRAVRESLGNRVLGPNLDLGWVGRLTKDLTSLPGGGAKVLEGPSLATN